MEKVFRCGRQPAVARGTGTGPPARQNPSRRCRSPTTAPSAAPTIAQPDPAPKHDSLPAEPGGPRLSPAPSKNAWVDGSAAAEHRRIASEPVSLAHRRQYKSRWPSARSAAAGRNRGAVRGHLRREVARRTLPVPAAGLRRDAITRRRRTISKCPIPKEPLEDACCVDLSPDGSTAVRPAASSMRPYMFFRAQGASVRTTPWRARHHRFRAGSTGVSPLTWRVTRPLKKNMLRNCAGAGRPERHGAMPGRSSEKIEFPVSSIAVAVGDAADPPEAGLATRMTHARPPVAIVNCPGW